MRPMASSFDIYVDHDATPDAIKKERKATRKDAIKQLKNSIESCKESLFRDQAKLLELLSSKKDEEIDYDD